VEVKHPDVVVTRRMQHGFVDQCLVELSSSMHAVVVGSHRSTRLSQMVWGSLASAVVEHADGVVVVVPPNHVPDARLSVP
jgi:nucleotide-binding universal stress UspA family protein